MPDTEPTNPDIPLPPNGRRLEALYRLHGRALYLYLLRRTSGDAHLAEDLVQETFLRAWRTPHVINNRGESCRPWLVTVARNLLIDLARGRGCRPQETVGDVLPLIPAQRCEIDQLVTSLALQKALAALPPRGREILVQIYLKDRSAQQVSEALGLAIGTVRSRTHAALGALRTELAALGMAGELQRSSQAVPAAA